MFRCDLFLRRAGGRHLFPGTLKTGHMCIISLFSYQIWIRLSCHLSCRPEFLNWINSRLNWVHFKISFCFVFTFGDWKWFQYFSAIRDSFKVTNFGHLRNVKFMCRNAVDKLPARTCLAALQVEEQEIGPQSLWFRITSTRAGNEQFKSHQVVIFRCLFFAADYLLAPVCLGSARVPKAWDFRGSCFHSKGKSFNNGEHYPGSLTIQRENILRRDDVRRTHTRKFLKSPISHR